MSGYEKNRVRVAAGREFCKPEESEKLAFMPTEARDFDMHYRYRFKGALN